MALEYVAKTEGENEIKFVVRNKVKNAKNKKYETNLDNYIQNGSRDLEKCNFISFSESIAAAMRYANSSYSIDDKSAPDAPDAPRAGIYVMDTETEEYIKWTNPTEEFMQEEYKKNLYLTENKKELLAKGIENEHQYLESIKVDIESEEYKKYICDNLIPEKFSYKDIKKSKDVISIQSNKGKSEVLQLKPSNYMKASKETVYDGAIKRKYYTILPGIISDIAFVYRASNLPGIEEAFVKEYIKNKDSSSEIRKLILKSFIKGEGSIGNEVTKKYYNDNTRDAFEIINKELLEKHDVSIDQNPQILEKNKEENNELILKNLSKILHANAISKVAFDEDVLKHLFEKQKETKKIAPEFKYILEKDGTLKKTMNSKQPYKIDLFKEAFVGVVNGKINLTTRKKAFKYAGEIDRLAMANNGPVITRADVIDDKGKIEIAAVISVEKTEIEPSKKNKGKGTKVKTICSEKIKIKTEEKRSDKNNEEKELDKNNEEKELD